MIEQSDEYLEIVMISQMTDEVDENLVSWLVTSVTPKEVEVKLEFYDFFEVSQELLPNQVIAKLKLNQLAGEAGQLCQYLKTDVPMQLLPESASTWLEVG